MFFIEKLLEKITRNFYCLTMNASTSPARRNCEKKTFCLSEENWNGKIGKYELNMRTSWCGFERRKKRTRKFIRISVAEWNVTWKRSSFGHSKLRNRTLSSLRQEQCLRVTNSTRPCSSLANYFRIQKSSPKLAKRNSRKFKMVCENLNREIICERWIIRFVWNWLSFNLFSLPMS